MKTLHLLRHAKSDWSHPGQDDHDRTLNQRGKRARNLVAGHVAGWHVDLVVCSTARRARETAKPVIETLGCPVRYDPALYAATTERLLAVVRALPDEHETVLLVGHNPSMEELTELLCGESPAYPTAALGTLALDVEQWAGVAPGCGTVTAFATPKELDASR